MSQNPNASNYASICFSDQTSKTSRQVMLQPGFPTSDLMSLLSNVFSMEHDRKVVGFRDDKIIYYTATTVCRSPSNFSRAGNKLTLVFEANGTSGSSSEDLYRKQLDFEDSEGTLLTDELAEKAFRLMDSDSDGLVSATDIANFIEHGVNIQTLCNDDASDRDIDELTLLFSSAFYNELAMDSSEPVTLNDFCAWFLSTNHVGMRTLVVDICKLYSNSEEDDFIHKTLKRSKSTPDLHGYRSGINPYDDNEDNEDNENDYDAGTTSSSYNSSMFSRELDGGHFVHDHVSTLHPIEVIIDEIKKNLRLDNTTLKGLYYALLSDDDVNADFKGDFLVSRQLFNSRMYSLINMDPFSPNNSFDMETIQNLINSLYSAFGIEASKDVHNNNSNSNSSSRDNSENDSSINGGDSINTDDNDAIVHISSILCGMNLFCKGRTDNNLAFTYTWFKNICNGFVNTTCIRLFFLNICNTMYAISNQLIELVEMKSKEFAGCISNAVFIQVTLNNPTQISKQEFIDCCQCGLDIIFQITSRELDFEQVFTSLSDSYKDDSSGGAEFPPSPDISSESSGTIWNKGGADVYSQTSGAQGDAQAHSQGKSQTQRGLSGLQSGSITSENTNLSRASTMSSKSADPETSSDRGSKGKEEKRSKKSRSIDKQKTHSFLLEYEGGTVNIRDAIRILGLKALQPADILEQVMDSFGSSSSGINAEEDFYLRRFEYNKVMQTLCVGKGKHYATLSSHDRSIFDFLIGRIFSTYAVYLSDSSPEAVSKADMCDSLELLIGLFSLCGGSPLDKAIAVITLMRRLNYLGLDEDKDEDEDEDEDEGEGQRDKNSKSEMVEASYLFVCIAPIIKLIGTLDPKLNNLSVLEDLSSGIATNFIDDYGLEEHIPSSILIKWIATAYKVLNNVNGQILIRQAILDNEVDSDNGLDRILEVLTAFVLKDDWLGEEEKGQDDADNDDGGAAADDDNSKNDNSNNDDDDDDDDKDDDEDDDDDNDDENDSYKYKTPTTRASDLRVDVNNTDIHVAGEVPNVVTDELHAAKGLFGFSGFSASDVMEMLAEVAPNAIVSQSKWLSLTEDLAKIAVIPEENMLLNRAIAKKVFGAFVDSEDGDSKVEPCCSYYDFAAGLVLLSDSSSEEKLMVSFTLVDSNRDGEISFFELCVLIHAYLNVICSLSASAAKKVASLGVSLETLADAVAKEGFHTLNLSLDSTLTINDVCEIANDCIFLADTKSL